MYSGVTYIFVIMGEDYNLKLLGSQAPAAGSADQSLFGVASESQLVAGALYDAAGAGADWVL